VVAEYHSLASRYTLLSAHCLTTALSWINMTPADGPRLHPTCLVFCFRCGALKQNRKKNVVSGLLK